ncbi:MAG: hypothetical protein WCP91_01770 [Candidatus Berkelbacteria bacterium]
MPKPIGLPPYVRAKEKCVFLAVDGKKDAGEVFAEIDKAVNGPILPHLAGVKFNDILHRADLGEQLVKDFAARYPHLMPFIPFVDLKSVDVWDTFRNYLAIYYPAYPGLVVTVSIHSSAQVFNKTPLEFPEARVAVFCVGTDVTTDECIEMYGRKPDKCAKKWIGVKEGFYSKWREGYPSLEKKEPGWPAILEQEHLAVHAISSAEMLPMYRKMFPWLGPVVPGVRDFWMLAGNQRRTALTKEALWNGAEYLVLGKQLTVGNKALGVDQLESQRRTARQIRLGLGTGSPDDAAEELEELQTLSTY